MKKLLPLLIAVLYPLTGNTASLSVDAQGNVINTTPTNFPTGKLKVNGVEVTGGGGGGPGVTDGDKGDITVSGTGTVWTIDNNVVSLAKLADMATASFLGRNTAGTGDPEVLSISTVKTMLALAIADVSGLQAALDAKLAALPIGNTLYVDAINGNDVTALPDRFDKPYLTLTAAKTASASGDTIVVRPGTYTESDITKTGVTAEIQNGAILTGGGEGFEGIAIVTRGSRVIGFGRLETADNAAIFYSDIDSLLLLACTIKQTASGTKIAPIYISDSMGAAEVVNIKTAEELSTAATTSDNAEGFTGVPAETVWWRSGIMYIESPKISGRGAISFDCVTASDGYVFAQDITGRLQTASDSGSAAGAGSTTAALWVRTSTLRAHSALVANPVISQNSPNRFYLTAQKLFGSVFIGSSAGPSYLNFDKWEATATASGSAKVFAELASTSQIVIHGNPTLDPKAFTGASIVSSGSDVTITGMRLVGNSGLNGLSITAGKLRLVNCLIDTSANSSTSPITKSGGTLILDNCTLRAHASANSITAATAQNVIVYNSRANMAKHANVTVQVGTLTVDTLVQ